VEKNKKDVENRKKRDLNKKTFITSTKVITIVWQTTFYCTTE